MCGSPALCIHMCVCVEVWSRLGVLALSLVVGTGVRYSSSGLGFIQEVLIVTVGKLLYHITHHIKMRIRLIVLFMEARADWTRNITWVTATGDWIAQDWFHLWLIYGWWWIVCLVYWGVVYMCSYIVVTFWMVCGTEFHLWFIVCHR